MRELTPEDYCHENLGERFQTALSEYDTLRRVETLVDEFLTDEMVAGAKALDVGCGYGYFSERLVQRGARVTACDIGPSLVEATVRRAGCSGHIADALALVEQFGGESFDIVLSSECIEHTPDPRRALEQMAALVRPGGWLAVSTPNILWYPVVRAASLVGARPFDGHENFSSFRSIRRVLEASNMEIVKEKGLHLWPFQIPLHSLSRRADATLQAARSLMINLCVLARKNR
jgi:2-polyprenyl-6-hydroxyphenyl methylase/3-demethylubiquinone-9 3-methyltransferase